MLDDITQAVLGRQEVVRYLQGGHGQTPRQARERVFAYLDELKTTQRYGFYRALKHPLYPILRKIDRQVEHLDIVRRAVETARLVYASNHKSHTDYLVEPLVLDDNGIRPPVIAAGINLFGGPLGLLHRHVTGAIPIRRDTKDPAYFVTLKAYVAESLRRRDLLFYPEGGRSYSGEMKALKTGLVQAAMQADCPKLLVIPTAIAYDLVLEDRILARQGVKKRQRPFASELAEMVGQAVGYRSRAIVTFGEPIETAEYDPQSRRDTLALAHRTRQAIGRLYKVLPTAVVASAMRPSVVPRVLAWRVEAVLERLQAAHANLDTTDVQETLERGVELLESRAILVVERGRYRVRDRTALRYYARTIAHLLPPAATRGR
jgi:1-acyl-sn-glycerol-3-phosphate acyltransferase